MSTVLQIITDALITLRVQDANEDVEAEIAESSLRALNRMMRRWEADGTALGWNDVETLSDPIPVPPEAEQAVVDNLAMLLRASYGVQLDPDVVERAKVGHDALLRDRLVAAPLVLKTHLRRPGRWWNIYTDEPY